MKFKVGDKVRVRTDLKVDKMYGRWYYTKSMDIFKGESVVIKKCYADSYEIDKDNYFYNWSDEMIIKEELTFQEVIATIKPNETYENTMSYYKVRSIHMNKCNEIQIHYIEDDIKPTSLRNDTVYIGGKQKFKLKEVKKPIIIYHIQHKPNGKKYKFVSDETLDIDNFVICDTQFGKEYGKVCSYEEMELTNVESEQYKKCWKA